MSNTTRAKRLRTRRLLRALDKVLLVLFGAIAASLTISILTLT